MTRSAFILICVVSCVGSTFVVQAQKHRDSPPGARLPGVIIRNEGQWNQGILYGDMLGRYAFTRDGVMLSRPRDTGPLAANGAQDLTRLDNATPLFYRFVNPSPNMRVLGAEAAEGAGNIYGGPDSARWRTGMPIRAGVVYRNVWDSVDAEFRETRGGLEMKLRLHPGARPRDVRMVSSDGGNIVLPDRSHGTGSQPVFDPALSGPTIMAGDGGYADSLAFGAEFSTYFSVRQEHEIESFKIHSDGSMFLSGITNAEYYGLDSVNYAHYVIHLSCDGRTILYTTLYYPTPGSGAYFGGWTQSPLCVRRDGHTISAGYIQMTGVQIPLTPDAMENQPSVWSLPTPYIFELDEAGRLHYASLFGTKPNESYTSVINALLLDSQENLLIRGYYYGSTFRYLTPGTASYGNEREEGSYLVKLHRSLDSIVWGIRFGGYNSGDWNAYDDDGMALDSMENLIIAGTVNTIKDSIPLIHAVYPDPPKDGGWYLQKLTPNADAFIFSSYLPGKADGHSDQGDGLCIGQGNTIHMAMDSWEGTHPVVNSTRGFTANRDGYYMHLAPDGRILRAFYLGGSSEDGLTSVALDRAGNVFITATSYSSDFPQHDPIAPSSLPRISDFMLIVLKAGTDSILLSTPWCGSHEPGGSGDGGGNLLHVQSTGYVSFAGNADLGLPVFNALRDHPNLADSGYVGYHDQFVTRLFLPFAGQNFLVSRVTGTDSLRLEMTHGILADRRFAITVHVGNPSARDTAYNVDVILRLPPGASLDSSAQSLTHRMQSPFLPGDSASHTWIVRMDSVRSNDTSLAFRVFTEFDLEPAPLGCDRPVIRGAHYVPVRRYSTPSPVFYCTLEPPIALYAAVGGDSLADNPFNVRGRITNAGARAFTLSALRLELTSGSPPWLDFASIGDSLRPGGTLPPGGELVRDWTIRAANMPQSREIALRVTVIDSVGTRLPGCAASIAAPGLAGVRCTLAGPDVIRYDADSGIYTPLPCTLNLQLANLLDTARGGIATRIDFTKAGHLQLAASDSMVKSMPPIPAHGAADIGWRVEVIPHPSEAAFDTVIVWYHAPGWTEDRSCMHLLRIIPPTYETACTLVAPPVAVQSNGDYAPDTLVVVWTLTNSGVKAAPAGVARLTISGDTSWALDPLQQFFPALAPNQNHVITWRLLPKTSAFNRAIALGVTARDSAQNEIARCETTLELPRIEPAIACTLSGPDTLRYMASTDAYSPDPFDLSYTVTNRVDTIATIDVRIDTTGAPHLGLATGETGTAALGLLAPHATTNATFRLKVATPPMDASSEVLRVFTAALFGNATVEESCQTVVAMEKRPCIFSADCFTAGHDTSWADTGNEDIIPHPLQMRLGIVNTGNETLDSITAAIILPAGYILTTPPDSIQHYAPIAPGDTGRREWLMEVNKVNTVPGTLPVRWTWSCGALVAGGCTRDATLIQAAPNGIALSRWRLDFRAERGGALPAAQSVAVWTGNNSPYQWQAASADFWLDASSGIITGRGATTIRPNTTALPDGFYEGTVRIVTNEFARPAPIEVGYEIYTLAGAAAPPAPTEPTLWCAPNPVRPGGVVRVRYALREPGPARLRLLDALGREVMAMTDLARQPGAHSVTLALPPRLAAGAYFVMLESLSGRMVSAVVVLR